MAITDNGQSGWGLIKRSLSYFKKYYLRVTVAMVSMAMVGLCTAAAAFLVQPAMDDIFINKDKSALIYIPLLLIGVFVAKGVFRFLQNYMMQYCGHKVLERIRNDLYTKMIRLPVRFYESNQVGMLMSRIINDVLLIKNSLPAVVMSIRQVFTMAALLGVVFYRDAFLAFWAVLVLPLAVFPFVYLGKKLRKLGRRGQSKIADIATFLQEIFSGVRVVKAFAREDEETRRFEKENERLVNISIRQVVVSELSSPVMELIGAVGAGLVIWYGGKEVIAGNSTPGTFFSFMAALVMLYDPVKKLNSANMDIQKALAGAERVFEILDSPEIQVEEGGTAVFEPPFEDLVLDNVRFTYSESPYPALDGVSLTVRAGERVAIVGPSGSGKTTLVNMIPRFYEPDSGRITLNGKKLTEYTLDSLRRSIGMVSQDAFLFNAPVVENIAYGQDNIEMDKVIEAAKAAYAHDFVMDLAHGYDTVVGERGARMSGGQKQRLTIARALLKNPPLLILDEATSALDSESERIVQQALENLMQDRTSIVIAHRLSTVLSANRIIVMEKGRIIAEGNHHYLLDNCALYAKLYKMQFSEQPEPGQCVV